MYKKICAAFAVMVLVIGFTACGNKNNTDAVDKGGNSAVPAVTDSSKGTGSDSEEVPIGLLSETYKVPLEDIYVDTPALKGIESGYSMHYLEDGIKCLTFICMSGESVSDPDSAFDMIFDGYSGSLSYCYTFNRLGEVKKDRITVNGIDALKLDGSVNVGAVSEYDAALYGYIFVFNGYPCAILGVVIDYSQPESEINAVKELADAMMNSVRSEK